MVFRCTGRPYWRDRVSARRCRSASLRARATRTVATFSPATEAATFWYSFSATPTVR